VGCEWLGTAVSRWWVFQGCAKLAPSARVYGHAMTNHDDKFNDLVTLVLLGGGFVLAVLVVVLNVALG
jgi:hypothetical protein